MTLLLLLLLKTLTVFAVSGLALLALRRASASARHLVCLLTLVALFALPLFSLTLPGWRLPVLAQEPAARQEQAAPFAAVPQAPSTSENVPPAPSHVGIGAVDKERVGASPTPTGSSPARPSLEVGWVLLLYPLGVLLGTLRPLLGLRGIAHLRRLCVSVTDAPTLALSAECTATLRLSRPITLAMADVPVPMTWGWRRPVVLLPTEFLDWPTDRTQAVLLHEMAHIKRRDWLSHRLADCVCVVYWFHPLVWLTARRLRAEGENACDDLVLASGIAPPDYARHLLDIARALPPSPRPTQSAIAMAQTSQIEGRLKMILDNTRSRRTLTRRVLLTALGLGTVALLALAMLRPTAKAQSIPKTLTDATSTAGVGVLMTVPNGSTSLNFRYSHVTSLQINHDAGPGQMSFTTSPDLAINGTTLFAGITDADKPGSPWWSATGALLPTPIYNTGPYRDFTKGNPYHNVGFAFRLPPNAQGITMSFKVPQSMGTSSDGVWPTKLQDNAGHTESQIFSATDGARIVTAAFPRTLKKASLQVGIAAGRWKTAVSEARVAGAVEAFGGTSTTFTGNQSFILGQPSQTTKDVVLTVSDNAADDIRVVAVDLQGNMLLPANVGGTSTNGLDQITAHFSQPVAQIKEFRVETRPFQWLNSKMLPCSQSNDRHAAKDETTMKHKQTPADHALWAALPMAQTSQIEGRLKMILDNTHSRRTLTRRVLLTVLGLGTVALLALAMLKPTAKADSLLSNSGLPTAVPVGVTVELVGVGSSPTGDGENWWGSDGRPLPETPEQGNARFHTVRTGIGTQYLRRALFFRLRSSQDINASTTGYVVDPSGHLQTYGYHFGRDLRLNDAALKANQPASGVALLGFPQSEQTITYRFGVASGPWQTVAVTKNTLHPASGTIKLSHDGYFYGPSAWLMSKPGVGYTDAVGKSHELSLLGSNPPLGDVARRLQAVDSAGQVIPFDEGGGDYRGDASVQISPDDLNRIAEFRLQTRPYQWTEFKDIALQPLAETAAAPIPTPPAPPGFQKTYSSGLTVALNALTQRRADGGQWWRPDGALLPGPIKDRDASFGGWPRETHPRALLFTLTAPRDIDYSEAIQFLQAGVPPEPVSQLDFSAQVQKGQPSESSRNEDFPADAKVCTLRYGIAAGAWDTVAVQKVNFTPASLLYRNVSPDKDTDGDVSLELSQQPKLIYKDAAGQLHDQPFLTHPLGEVARQIIAVNANGTAIPLAVCGNGRDFSIISLAFSDHSAFHNYNPKIDLTQIRELRLQTRLYEWAEFKEHCVATRQLAVVQRKTNRLTMKHKRSTIDYALWAALPMAQTSQIEGRLTMILDNTRRRVSPRRFWLVTTLAGAIVLVPLAVLRPTARATPETTAKWPLSRATVVHADLGEQDADRLVADGQALTPEAASALERTLALHPEDYTVHIRLLGYYNSRQSLNEKAYQQQVFWLIRTHPYSVLAGTGYIMLLKSNSPAAYAKGKALWLEQIARQPKNAKILGNAAEFCLYWDQATAENLLRKAEVLEPKSPHWPDKLGELYNLQSRGPNPSAEVVRQSAKKALAEYERVAVLAANPTSANLARTAFDAGEYDKAQRYASSLLQRSKTEKGYWDQSGDIQSANLILGRLALRDGDTAGAEAYLLAMGHVSGSPTLGSFGPNMQLAQDLLKAGRRDTVLAYFDECAKFWTYQPGKAQLATWKTEVQQGKMPNFGGNLID